MNCVFPPMPVLTGGIPEVFRDRSNSWDWVVGDEVRSSTTLAAKPKRTSDAAALPGRSRVLCRRILYESST